MLNDLQSGDSQSALQNQDQSSFQSSNTTSVLSGNASQSTLAVSGGTPNPIAPDYTAIAMTGLLIVGVLALILIIAQPFRKQGKTTK